MTPLLRRSFLALCAASALIAPSHAADRVGAGEVTLGNPNAKVKVVEYASVTCPHCAAWNEAVFPDFKRKYIDTGLVQYVFREFPTQPVNVAAAGFMIARCAGREKYFDVVDALFESQSTLATGDALKFLTDAGKVAGMDEAAVRACVQDEAALAGFNNRVRQALEVDKIGATPTFVIGDRKLEGGQSLAQLDAVIQPLLAAR